ncbi:MAG: ABC-F family ATP-binding cassette domain-containing protein [Caldilineaceae bacterium]|nr:ABC-F family ATP-binding cassette domain-containing protein [Caldilineaceae bacterium]
MNLLTIQHLTKQFSERLLFEDADLLINEGDRIGLIGVNGSGKSTLLRIAAGLEAPDQGSVTSPGGVRIEYLAQEPELDDTRTVLEAIFHSDSPQMQLLRAYEETGDALLRAPADSALQTRLMELGGELDRTGGWAAEANAKAILTRLGVTYFDAPIATLSGGQRKRVALARALIDRADLLVLDEPTNHIDADTVAWLEDYLATTPGALLMVTHDRYFLDRVVNRIVELDRRRLVSYSGNYTRYLNARASHHERLAAAEQKRQKLLQRELAWLRRMPMARGTKQKARKQRVDELLELQYDAGEDRVSIALASRRLGKQALDAQGLVKRFGDACVLDGVALHLEPGERLGIMGPNGAGKSTLLNILAGALPPDKGSVRWGETVKIGYYDQRSAGLDPRKRVIELIEDEAALIQTKDGDRIEAAQMLEWFLFPRPMQWARVGSLSGGERRRLYLLRTLVHQPNVLLLDEPTNDLDIQTLTVLEEFLDHFAGCLVVVSHDRYFLDRTVDHLAEMQAGKLGPRYPTPYSTFIRLSQAAAPSARQETSAPPPQKAEPPRSSSPSSRKLSWKEARELEALEARIAQLETEKARLHTAMSDAGDDYQRLQELVGELEKAEAQLDDALERWFELEERKEAG